MLMVAAACDVATRVDVTLLLDARAGLPFLLSVPTDTLVSMSAAAAPTPECEAGRRPFADATPAQVRAALVPEDAVEFDRQWREAMATAADALDLTGVHRTLESWRRVAWLTTARGQDGYRALLAGTDRRTRTGAGAAGSVSLDQVKAMIAERLG